MPNEDIPFEEENADDFSAQCYEPRRVTKPLPSAPPPSASAVVDMSKGTDRNVSLAELLAINTETKAQINEALERDRQETLSSIKQMFENAKSDDSNAPLPTKDEVSSGNGLSQLIGMMSNMMRHSSESQAEMMRAMREETNNANSQMIENFKALLTKEPPPPLPPQINVLEIVNAIKGMTPEAPKGPSMIEVLELAQKMNTPIIEAIKASFQKNEAPPSKTDEFMNIILAKAVKDMSAPREREDGVESLSKALSVINKVKSQFAENVSEANPVVIPTKDGSPSLMGFLLSNPMLVSKLMEMMENITTMAQAPKVSDKEINDLKTGLIQVANALRDQRIIQINEYKKLSEQIKGDVFEALKMVSQDERIVGANSPVAENIKKTVMNNIETIQRKVDAGDVVHDNDDDVLPQQLQSKTASGRVIRLKGKGNGRKHDVATAPPPPPLQTINVGNTSLSNSENSDSASKENLDASAAK